MTETHKRTIARAVCWRIIATLVTAIWAGWSGAIMANVVLTVLHYIHERLWLKISWGHSVKSLEENHDRVDANAPQQNV